MRLHIDTVVSVLKSIGRIKYVNCAITVLLSISWYSVFLCIVSLHLTTMRTLGTYVGTLPTQSHSKRLAGGCSATSRASISERSSTCSIGTLDENEQDTPTITDALSLLLKYSEPRVKHEIKGALRDVVVRVYVDQQHQQPIIALSAKCHGEEVEGVHPIAWKNRITEQMQILAKESLYEIQQWYVHKELNVKPCSNDALPYWRNEEKEYNEVLPSNYLVSARITSINWNGDTSRFWANVDGYDTYEVYETKHVHRQQPALEDPPTPKANSPPQVAPYAMYDGLYEPSRHGDVCLEAMCSVECKRMPAPWNDEPCTNIASKLENVPHVLNSCTFHPTESGDTHTNNGDYFFCLDIAYFSKIEVVCTIVS